MRARDLPYMNIDNITGITVVHNTKDLIERAYNSIRKFHPSMKIIIVDGSDRSSPCFDYVSNLTSDANTRVFHVDRNIGHGRGLCVGIEKTETSYALIFDSDIEMLKSPIQAMSDMMGPGIYGVGYTEKTAFDGHEWGSKSVHKTQGWMRYLHPYFCLIDLREYKRYKPFIHHGAPAVNTMLDIHRRGLGDKVIKEFPGLGHSSGIGWVWKGEPREFIRHDTYGTRAIRRSKGLEEIEGVWERVVDEKKNNEITCITCTGDRPLAFSLCKRWMQNQTVKNFQWIVVDDGKIPIEDFKFDGLNYAYRSRGPYEPDHTMILNLHEAFKLVDGRKILFIEDDEYYAPNYIEEMAKRLDRYKLVGIGRSKYYHLPTFRWGIHSNMGHASLAQTAFHVDIFDEIKNSLLGDCYFDIRVWKIVNGDKASLKSAKIDILECISEDGRGLIFEDRVKSLYSGMKGLPGRVGIGAGHNSKQSFYNADTNKVILKRWVEKKEDYNMYLTLLENERKRVVRESGRLVGIPSKGRL